MIYEWFNGHSTAWLKDLLNTEQPTDYKVLKRSEDYVEVMLAYRDPGYACECIVSPSEVICADCGGSV